MKASLLMKRAVALFSMILGLSTISFAQHTIKGTIVDKQTSEDLPFVNIALLRTNDSVFVRGASSNDHGRFVISDVDTGQYFLHIKNVGYHEVMQPIIIMGDSNLGKIQLTQGTILKEVKIVGDKPLYAMDGEKNMYNVSDDPSIQTGTASDALQNAPDVEVDVEGNIKLRGVSAIEIWINNMPSHLEGESLKQYIKTLPANAIERIEVITNPSARYKNQSGGGIINIITNQKIKRNEYFSFGLNGSMKPNISPWVSYVYANEKLNINLYLNGNFSGNHNISTSQGTMFDTNHVISQVEKTESESDSRHIGTYFNFSIDYHIDSVNYIGGWMGIYPSWDKYSTETSTERQEYYTSTDYNSFLGNTKRMDKSNYNGGYIGAWYEHKFDTLGQRLEVDISGNFSGYNSAMDYERMFIPYSPLSVIENKQTEQPSTSSSISANYTLPYSRHGEFDFGIDGSFYNSASFCDVKLFDSITNQFLVDDTMTTSNVTNQQSLDAYATWQHRFGGFTIKLGLRGEYSHRSLQYPDDSLYNMTRAYFNLVPTIHLSYRTKSMHNFNLSFSRRCSNPGVTQLTRYITYNLDGFSVGNPDLTSSYTYNINGGWNKYFTKFGSVGINGYYSGHTNNLDYLTDVMYLDYYGRIVTFSKPINVGNSRNMGISLNLTYRPTGFFNIRFNASVRNNYFDFEYRPGERLEKNITSFNCNLNIWAKLFNKLEVHASGNYSSKSQSMFSVTKPYKGINLGINADFFDRKLSAYINVNDIFNWNVSRYENTNPYYQTTSSSKYTSRYISAGITLRFGKMELEGYARQGSSDAPSLKK